MSEWRDATNGGTSDQDQTDYNEYIGEGEAHTVPPFIKKMKFSTPTQTEPKSKPKEPKSPAEEPTEPKSSDVFASSQSSGDGSYETCPETTNATIIEEEGTPPPPGSKTMRFDEDYVPRSARKAVKTPKSSSRSSKNEPESAKKAAGGPGYFHAFDAPKIVENGLKSAENEMEMEETTPTLKETPKKMPSKAMEQRLRESAKRLHFDTVDMDSDLSSGNTHGLSTVFGEKSPEEAPPPRGDNDEEEEEMEDDESGCSDESDEEEMNSMKEEIERRMRMMESDEPEDVIGSSDRNAIENEYGRIESSSSDPSANSSILRKSAEYHGMEVDEALEEEANDDDDDHSYDRKRIVVSPEEKEIQNMGDEIEIANSEQQHPQNSGTTPSALKKNPESRKRAANDAMHQLTTSVRSSSSSEQHRKAPTRPDPEYEHEMIKNRLEFQEKKLVFRPDFVRADPKQNYRYCEVNGVPNVEAYYRQSSESLQKTFPQIWQPVNCSGEPNRMYSWQKSLLQCWLRDYRSNGSSFQLFCGLIQEMTRRHVSLVRFHALERYFMRMADANGESVVMAKFARVVKLALQAEEVLPARIYYVIGDVISATFSHIQCACLVARMFFNDPNRNRSWSFFDLLRSESPVAVEKLKFIFTYTDKMATSPPTGCVSFRRYFVADTKQFCSERQHYPLPNVRFWNELNIENTALCTQVDFANQYLGGGVLTHGAVQEEIRFLMCPEMMVSMMLLPRGMHKNEAFSIVGAYVFSSYSGYSQQLKWQPLESNPSHSRQNDPRNRDKYGRLQVETVAIDATKFSSYYSKPSLLSQQLNVNALYREFLKAAIGFDCQKSSFEKIPIVSGWWGCGAFNGDKPTKFLLQVIAAGLAKRRLDICTFGEREMAEKCEQVMKRLEKLNMTVGKLYGHLKRVKSPISRAECTPYYVFDALFAEIQRSNEEEKRRTASSSSSISNRF